VAQGSSCPTPFSAPLRSRRPRLMPPASAPAPWANQSSLYVSQGTRGYDLTWRRKYPGRDGSDAGHCRQPSFRPRESQSCPGSARWCSGRLPREDFSTPATAGDSRVLLPGTGTPGLQRANAQVTAHSQNLSLPSRSAACTLLPTPPPPLCGCCV